MKRTRWLVILPRLIPLFCGLESLHNPYLAAQDALDDPTGLVQAAAPAEGRVLGKMSSFSGQAPSAAPASPLPRGREAGTPSEQGYIINFNDVSIIEYIRFISKISKKNFIFDETDLQFNVTIVSDEPATITNIMTALMQVLRTHGLWLMEQGNNLLIHRNDKIPTFPGAIDNTRVVPGAGEPELITELFHIKNADPVAVGRVVQSLLSPQAHLDIIPEARVLVLTDLSSNVSKIATLLGELDAETAMVEMAIFRVRNLGIDELIDLTQKVFLPIARDRTFILVPHYAIKSIIVVTSHDLLIRAEEVMRVLDNSSSTQGGRAPEGMSQGGPGAGLQGGPGGTTAAGPGGAEGPGAGGGAEGPGALGGSPAGGMGAVPGEGGTPGGGAQGPGFNEASSSRLSQGGQIGGFESGEAHPGAGNNPFSPMGLNRSIPYATSFGIVKLQYRKGDALQKALRDLATSLRTVPVVDMELIGTINSVEFIPDANVLVFTGTQDTISRVKDLIEQLDVPLREVFIEMLIIETDVDDSLTFGVEWGERTNAPLVASGSGLVSSTSQPSPLPVSLNAVKLTTSPSGNALALTPGFHAGIIGKTITHNGLGFNTLGALITSLRSDTETEILMNPKIITEDQTAATVFVGETDLFKGQSISNDQGTVITNNFEYRDVGATLKVTPYLGNNDIISLEISQEVSAATPTTISTAQNQQLVVQPVARKSTTTTRIHVPNNYFVILSGMIHEEDTKSRFAVPCLGSLPLVGGLFGETDRTKTKRNLMIFIRPRLVDTAEEIETITKREQDIYRGHKQRPDDFAYELESLMDACKLGPCDKCRCGP